MSKRLQIVLGEAEYDEYKRVAMRRGLTLAEWVRQVLRRDAGNEPSGDADRKLAVIRASARHAYPTADIEQMLAEIESGYARSDDA
jgi:hypothetical protein